MEKKTFFLIAIIIIAIFMASYFLGSAAVNKKEVNEDEIAQGENYSAENKSEFELNESKFNESEVNESEGPIIKTITIGEKKYSIECAADYECKAIDMEYGEISGAICVNYMESGTPNSIITCACTEDNICEPKTELNI